MTKRRLFIMLAVVAMAMSAMAPASAGRGNTGDERVEKEWVCDNCPPFSFLHCARVDIEDWVGSPGPGNALNVLVYSEDGAEFLGTEILRFSGKDIEGRNCGKGATWTPLTPTVFACHHWHGGTPPA